MPARNLSLDEAIRLSLGNSTVVRVLAGVEAVSSGRTIYDTAMTNTEIAQQRARFDPQVSVENIWGRMEQPEAFFDPLHPGRSQIAGLRSDDYRMQAGVSKQTVLGGEARVGVNANPTRIQPGELPLNPSSRSSLELSYSQPLLQGGGSAVNLAPIVLARHRTPSGRTSSSRTRCRRTSAA